jgi:hypothetical protein
MPVTVTVQALDVVRSNESSPGDTAPSVVGL